MLLEVLNNEEKMRFLDLAYYMINADNTKIMSEEEVLESYKNEMGEIEQYKKLNPEKAINILKKSSKMARRVILLNLIKISLADDFYHSEEHLIIEDLLAEWDISASKKAELVKLVYQEKDLREKTKMVVSE